ncbi:MAG: DUF2141 domain-containing protein [Candidatus Obscuribacterales bacterium]|nr:DUF2141 domain-containing protein [Candidatus Obscuribacterales bacterium]
MKALQKLSIFSFSLVFAAIAIFTVISAKSEGQNGSVIVHVSGFGSDRGVARFMLFNDESEYLKDKFNGLTAFKIGTASIKNTEANYVFRDIPYGEYAIKLFHDPDKTGLLPRNRLGGAKSEYGFSNNAKGRFGPPSFENAKFTLQNSEIYMNIDAIK